jgi:hypothetical protein
MWTVTANYSKEAWEFESLPRSAREADKIVPPITPKRPLSLRRPLPFLRIHAAILHTCFLSCDVFAQFASTKCGNDKHACRTHSRRP